MLRLMRVLVFLGCMGSVSTIASNLFFQSEDAQFKISLDTFQTVSCDKSATLCVAVGSSDDSPLANLQVYKTQDSGMNWSSPITLPAVSNEQISKNYFVDVSCNSSAQRCVIVRSTSIGKYPTLVTYTTQDGGLSWSKPLVLPLPPSVYNQKGFVMARITCDDSGVSCKIAGGFYGDEVAPLLYTTKDAGHQWKLITSLQEPDGTLAHFTQLNSIACDANGVFCMAVGSAYTQDLIWGFIYSIKPLIYTTEDSGESWNSPITLSVDDADAELYNFLLDVACSETDRRCSVFGANFDSDSQTAKYFSVMTNNGGLNWEKQRVVTLSSSGSQIYSLDCDAKVMSCSIVGFSRAGSGVYKPVIYNTSNGGENWTRDTQFKFPQFSALSDIFCSKVDGRCVAVGIRPNEETYHLVSPGGSFFSHESMLAKIAPLK